MEIDKCGVPLFNGNNFSNWKYRMEIVLEEQDLLQFVHMDHGSLAEDQKKNGL